jgi:hypothetical protein
MKFTLEGGGEINLLDITIIKEYNNPSLIYSGRLQSQILSYLMTRAIPGGGG